MHEVREIWTEISISRIEHLSDAVVGAGLDAVQMTKDRVRGSLAFSERDGVRFTSGMIDGTVSLRGSLSADQVTLGVALAVGPGSWHWMKEIVAGSVGIFRAGDIHDALYRPGSQYVAATLTLETLEAEAEREGLVLDHATLGGTRQHERSMDVWQVATLRERLGAVHRDAARGPLPAGADLCGVLMRSLTMHCAREPHRATSSAPTYGYARIVARARAYIHGNLEAAITVDALAEAAATSRRTLFRAFIAVLGEPPQNYVRRLRLHRIRHDLASDQETAYTIALIANRWGIDQPGRLSGWYRELFGELPSETVARRQAGERHDAAIWHDPNSKLARIE